jgi:pimeloyl-ACP methyl ester carboxylesterase
VGDLELPRAEDGLAPDRPVTREWGAGGRPLVFWPGLNPWGELQLVEVGPLLAERGFHVVSLVPPIVDDPDAYLPTRLAKHVLDVADGRGIDRFVFMGHSWGASIGVHLAADHPDRVERLVLLDAGHTDVRDVGDRDALSRSSRPSRRRSSSTPGTTSSAGRSASVLASGELERFRSVVPHARVEIVESGHDVPQDAPEALVSLVSEWAG